ncbi:hypothetical protein RVR34_12070 [Microcystis aeruginosa FBCC-A68]|nr:hypothetical protein [Microcystis aeruginosa]
MRQKVFRGGRVWGVGCGVLPIFRTFGKLSRVDSELVEPPGSIS